ncbi:MAG: hypothetical protein IPL59_24140 [Candidatus Competibacteraceae bacterium]|uniref:Uncharacterized protein n=1 Tax=Candidatus Contendobacter odensis Run_B_J11 TaxID=1400861 RepID=A0A7U7J5K4_9GAMM|nr:hypothetical protein [Candidatus Contendobacter odensis]MBK8537924.1 hypothetical protein [Candidatus Competibacteraceae bacterium]MBK8750178.1 hypothetical protein [Candidatus Competibacteraceae bacterium]CDH47437.1 hypothetical protein BN874_810008 [Candidatus Contendobacter odensis Run_B_J11]
MTIPLDQDVAWLPGLLKKTLDALVEVTGAFVTGATIADSPVESSGQVVRFLTT